MLLRSDLAGRSSTNGLMMHFMELGVIFSKKTAISLSYDKIKLLNQAIVPELLTMLCLK